MCTFTMVYYTIITARLHNYPVKYREFVKHILMKFKYKLFNCIGTFNLLKSKMYPNILRLFKKKFKI